MAAALPFVPYVSLGMSVVQAKQQSAIGKFNLLKVIAKRGMNMRE